MVRNTYWTPTQWSRRWYVCTSSLWPRCGDSLLYTKSNKKKELRGFLWATSKDVRIALYVALLSLWERSGRGRLQHLTSAFESVCRVLWRVDKPSSVYRTIHSWCPHVSTWSLPNYMQSSSCSRRRRWSISVFVGQRVYIIYIYTRYFS